MGEKIKWGRKISLQGDLKTQEENEEVLQRISLNKNKS